MQRTLFWLLLLGTLVLLVWGGARTWQRQHAQQAALAQDMSESTSKRLLLQPDEIITVNRRELPLQVALTGTIRPVNTVSVKAQTSGQVLGLSVREGQAVKQGQILFRIAAQDASARLQQAQQQTHAALAQLQIAQRDVENNRALADKGFISATALTNAQLSLHAAQANYRAAQAGVEVARKAVTDTSASSPIDGVIATRHIQPDEVVSTGSPVLDIVDLGSFELHGIISAQDSTQVQIGQAAVLQIEGTPQNLAATVVRVNPTAQTGSRAIAVYLAIEPGPTASTQAAVSGTASTDISRPALQLRNGLFARGNIIVGTIHGLAVPQTAIRTDKTQPYVLVLEGDASVVRQRTVQLAERSSVEGVVWQVVSGIEDGAKILTGAVGLLEDGTRVQLAGTGASSTAP